SDLSRLLFSFLFFFLWGELDKMGSRWHAVCSEYQAQSGGRVVEIKAESYAKNSHCQKERETGKARETGVEQIKKQAL
uniref:Uncharacterized protein n=1 Tax=Lates calcarifer TaxID=8187 RepID=A0A4W6EV46_LATCA